MHLTLSVVITAIYQLIFFVYTLCIFQFFAVRINVIILFPHTNLLKKNYKCDINHDFFSHVIFIFCFIFFSTVISLCFQSFIQHLLSAYYMPEVIPGNRNSKMNKKQSLLFKKQSLHLRTSDLDIKTGIYNLIEECWSCRLTKACEDVGGVSTLTDSQGGTGDIP